MKEPYGEGLATHTDPESCGELREEGAEALTGARAGRVLSREIARLRDADAVGGCGRQQSGASPARDAAEPRAVTDPWHVRKHLAREPGGPESARRLMAATGRVEKSKDARQTMNGHRKSDSSVLPEKPPNKAGANGGGGGGGKGTGQGEPAPAKRAPDPGPGRRAKCAGADTSGGSRDRKMRFTALLHHVYAGNAARGLPEYKAGSRGGS